MQNRNMQEKLENVCTRPTRNLCDIFCLICHMTSSFFQVLDVS
jgi:hypothetical protein